VRVRRVLFARESSVEVDDSSSGQGLSGLLARKAEQ
jgi:hypothetical protein